MKQYSVFSIQYSARRVFITLLLATCYLLLPTSAQAQSLLPKCTDVSTDQTYDTIKACLTSVGALAVQWVLAIALIALIVTGYLYVTSLGNKAQAEQAKNSFLFITIGILVVLGAYLVVNTFATAFLK